MNLRKFGYTRSHGWNLIARRSKGCPSFLSSSSSGQNIHDPWCSFIISPHQWLKAHLHINLPHLLQHLQGTQGCCFILCCWGLVARHHFGQIKVIFFNLAVDKKNAHKGSASFPRKHTRRQRHQHGKYFDSHGKNISCLERREWQISLPQKPKRPFKMAVECNMFWLETPRVRKHAHHCQFHGRDTSYWISTFM